MARTIDGASSQPLRSLFERSAVAGCDDGQLLERFASDRRDEAAFEALVARHGPMVWATARAVLRHEQDAEDAFQATFLTLARRAGSVRGGASLAAWLHRVAYRSAVEASQAARRRRTQEEVGGRLKATAGTEPGGEPDLAATVRLEVERLPAVNRLAVILCDLEGLTYQEAADRLGWTEPTLRNRLAQARSRLKRQLERRGFAHPLAWGLAPSRFPVPESLTRTALALALGRTAASTTVLSIAQTLAQGMSVMHHWKLISAALVAATALAAVGYATATPSRQLAADSPRSTPTASLLPPPPEPAADAVARGRVIDPAGRPVAGALVRTILNFNHPAPPTPVATGPDGTFALPVPPRFRQAEPMAGARGLIASAPGFGPGWTVDTLRPDVVIRLVPPGPPVEGRIVDPAGKPVAGATIAVEKLFAPVLQTTATESGTLAPVLTPPEDSELWSGTHALSVLPTSTTTDTDGRFHLTDFGPERVVVLKAQGASFVTTRIYATTRAGAPVTATRREMVWTRPYTFQPARFEQAMVPTRPIAGVITDASSGRPLAGWKIQGADIESIAYVADDVEATTDAQGRYTLTGLPVAPKYRIFLAPPPGQPYLPAGFKDVKAPEGDGSITLDHAARPGVVIRGRITDGRTGAPLLGHLNAEAFLSNSHLKDYPGYADSQLVYRYTDADGRYEVVVPPGPGIVGFRARDEGRYRSGQGAERIAGYDPKSPWFATVGRETGRGNYHVLAGVDPAVGAGPITLDLRVGDDRTIELRVVDAEGRPVDGTEVTGLGDFNGPMAVWQESATITVPALAADGTRTVTVRHPGRKLAGSLVVRAAGANPQTLSLGPWGEIRGRIMAADGTPCPGMGLEDGPLHGTSARTESFGLLPLRSTNRAIATDDQGRFHIVGLVPGVHYGASAQWHGEITIGNLFDDVTVAPGEVKDLGDLPVRPLPTRPPAPTSRP